MVLNLAFLFTGLLNMACLKLPTLLPTVPLLVCGFGLIVGYLVKTYKEIKAFHFLDQVADKPHFFIYLVLPALLMRKCFALDMSSFSLEFVVVFLFASVDFGELNRFVVQFYIK